VIAFLLAVALQAAPDGGALPEAQATAAPILNEIVFEGATAYDRQALLGAVRLETGKPLRPQPEAVARVLETFYRLEGYLGASVRGRFDPTAGVLTLAVEEGRLESVEVEGLRPDQAESALRALALETGRPLREVDLWQALSRLNELSEGAIRPAGEEPYTVTTGPEGSRVVFHLHDTRVQVIFRGAGPRNVGRINRVDGVTPGVALELSLSDTINYNHWRFVGVAAYGFSAETLRYGVGVIRGLGPAHRWSFGYSYHDWTETDDSFRRYGLEEARGGPINTEQGTELFRRYGHEGFVHRKLGPRAQVGVLFRSDDYRSLPVANRDEPIPPDDPDYNPPIEEGLMRSFIFTVRWTSGGDLFENQQAELRAVTQPSFYGTDWFRKPEALRVDATYEVATTGLGSDFDFTRFIGRLRWHRELGDRFGLDGRIFGGLTSGDPPLPKLFALGGLNTLRGYERKRIQGERMFIATLEGAYYPPGRFTPALIGFWDGGGAWGGEPTADGRRFPAGWKDDLGLAVRFPQRASRIFGRLDVAWPLSPLPGQDGGPRVNFRFQLPF
jgi:hemolysin activation/secretion protein